MLSVLLLRTDRCSLKFIMEQVARASSPSNSVLSKQRALEFYVRVINHIQSSFSQPFIKLIHDLLYARYSAAGGGELRADSEEYRAQEGIRVVG